MLLNGEVLTRVGHGCTGAVGRVLSVVPLFLPQGLI